MIKQNFCDICGKELLQGQPRVKYKLKREKPYDDLPWVEIEVHEQCVKTLLDMKLENENNDD